MVVTVASWMVQFQGMFAEYKKARPMKRYRHGNSYRPRPGSVNVLIGAPFGYRYIRKTSADPRDAGGGVPASP